MGGDPRPRVRRAPRSLRPRGGISTLWLHGEDDRLVPIDATRAGIERVKGSRFTEVTFPGARHEIFNETNNDEVLAIVRAFALDHV